MKRYRLSRLFQLVTIAAVAFAFVRVGPPRLAMPFQPGQRQEVRLVTFAGIELLEFRSTRIENAAGQRMSYSAGLPSARGVSF